MPVNLLLSQVVSLDNTKTWQDTVDGRNPAPVGMVLYAYGLQGFYTSQVVQDFFHQQYVRDTLGHLNMFSRIFRRSLAILS